MRTSPLLLACCAALLATHASARDRILLAVPSDDADQGIRRSVEAALRDRAGVEDATAAWRTLHAGAPLPSGALATPVPAWWPKALEPDWTRGAAACRTFAPPPYDATNLEAIRCGARLAEALWQRWLEHRAPDLFIAVLVELTDSSDSSLREEPQRLRVIAFRPGEPSQRKVERSQVPRDDLREVAANLASRLARGGGTRSTRAILTALPTPKRAVEAPLRDLPPVKLPRGCRATLPGTLELDPADARLARKISALWSRSVARSPRQGSLRCAIDPAIRAEELVGRRFFLGSATLRCGEARLVSKLQNPSEGALEEALARHLVEQLLIDRCAR